MVFKLSSFYDHRARTVKLFAQNLIAWLSSLDPLEELPLPTWKDEPNNINKGNYYDQQITPSTYYVVLVGKESKNNRRAKKIFLSSSLLPHTFFIFSANNGRL